MKRTPPTDAATRGRPAPHPCGYLDDVLRLAVRGLVPAGQLSHLTVAHDSWCPVLGGAGTKPCEPEFYLNGVPVTFPAEGENLT